MSRKRKWQVRRAEGFNNVQVFDVYERVVRHEDFGQVWVHPNGKVECAGCQTPAGRPMSRSCVHVRAFKRLKSNYKQKWKWPPFEAVEGAEK
jgi:hypothetical protein